MARCSKRKVATRCSPIARESKLLCEESKRNIFWTMPPFRLLSWVNSQELHDSQVSPKEKSKYKKYHRQVSPKYPKNIKNKNTLQNNYIDQSNFRPKKVPSKEQHPKTRHKNYNPWEAHYKPNKAKESQKKPSNQTTWTHPPYKPPTFKEPQTSTAPPAQLRKRQAMESAGLDATALRACVSDVSQVGLVGLKCFQRAAEFWDFLRCKETKHLIRFI